MSEVQREEAGLTELGVGWGKAGSPALTGLSTVSMGLILRRLEHSPDFPFKQNLQGGT